MKARVVFSNVGFLVDGRRHSAKRGEVIELPGEEFDRLAALGAVTTFAGGGQRRVEPEPEPEVKAPPATPEVKPKAPKPKAVRSGLGNR